MTIDSTVSAPQQQVVPVVSDLGDGSDRNGAAPADVEELLVEEVSIDGMCGVY